MKPVNRPGRISEMPAEIRIARVEDIDNLVSMVNLAYRPQHTTPGWTHESAILTGHRVTPRQIQSLLTDDSFVFVLEEDQQIATCIHLQINGGTACLGMLATRPDLQGKGYGKTILAWAEQYARKNFSICIFQMTVITARTELMAFYMRRGYQPTGQVFPYPVATGIGIPKAAGLTMAILEKCD